MAWVVRLPLFWLENPQQLLVHGISELPNIHVVKKIQLDHLGVYNITLKLQITYKSKFTTSSLHTFVYNTQETSDTPWKYTYLYLQSHRCIFGLIVTWKFFLHELWNLNSVRMWSIVLDSTTHCKSNEAILKLFSCFRSKMLPSCFFSKFWFMDCVKYKTIHLLVLVGPQDGHLVQRH